MTCRSAIWCSAATNGCSRTAASTTPRSADARPARRTVAVAFSGGLDSTVLLHATVAVAAPLGVQVLALHVHHGLSTQADRWLAHGRALCTRWARQGKPVAFVAEVLREKPGAGESVEAWARTARYRALRRMALDGGADIVLLAHHRRDQAETFVLQALRGGGVAALSAMPRHAHRDGVTWARPWLETPRDAIEAYAKRHRLRHVDDDTNEDRRFARNRLRASVWPALLDAFPEAEAALTSAAQWAQQANDALAEWAAIDVPAVSDGDALDFARWHRLSHARRSNALRVWLRERRGRPAAATLVERVLHEWRAVGSQQWPMPTGALKSHRGTLRCEAEATRLSQPLRAAMVGALQAGRPQTTREAGCIDLGIPGRHAMPEWGGTMRVESLPFGGLPLRMAAALEFRERAPGDRFQAGPGRPSRSLKLQYQAAGVPAWQRNGPIAWHGDAIAFVPGLGIDARLRAGDGEAQVGLTWLPDAAG